MIKAEQLYAATNDGLDIITLHYPEAAESARTGKPFRMRNERTPSSYVKKFKSKDGYEVWKVTDFGGEGKAVNPIDIHMDQSNLNFVEALLDLGGTFGVTDELNRAVNRPVITKEPAGPDQKEGDMFWEIDQEFSEEDCKTMGPRVTKEDLASLHWYRAKYIARVSKDREIVYTHSNEHYPIFVRECWFEDKNGKQDRFYKIYKPKEPDKQWRFSYYPLNKKPQQYTNGLFELSSAWSAWNLDLEKQFNADPANEGKAFKPEKLPEAIICSGERDAMCARALGYWPVWFNSETYKVSEAEFRQICKYVETVYNIPDIDTTGRIKGRELAMRFIDIHTIWLPESLQQRKDNRGKPRKDFRDWCELYSTKEDFKKLYAAATPAKFWFTEKNKQGDLKYKLDPECLCEFLHLNGFAILSDENSATPRYINITGNVVKPSKPSELRHFVHKWAKRSGLPRALRNVILTSPYFANDKLENLPEIELDFSTSTKNSQLFHFPRYSVEVKSDGCRKIDSTKESIDYYVWKDKIIPHEINILSDMFVITHPEGSYNSEDFRIEIKSTESKFFKYLINTSRIFWRKEMETRFSPKEQKQREEYCDTHRFDIHGEGLTTEEIREQERNLINKIFTVGFMLHRYKDHSRQWSPFLMDNLIGDNDQCNGGSGKSFMIESLRNLVTGKFMDGRGTKLLENKFLFEQVDSETDFVCFDDCAEGLDFGQFYNKITSDIIIDAKNVKSYTLRYSESPKFVFTTNYVPREFNPSTVRRMLAVTFSDYYHQSTDENDYIETRRIYDDFGKALFQEEYTEEEWNSDLNFMLQCVKFYLSTLGHPIKIEPDIRNIVYRKYKRDMSENFLNWAEYYFAEEGDNLDRLIVKEDAFNAYKTYSGLKNTTMNTFKKSLVGFCYTCEWIEELNPETLQNSGKRILKRVKRDESEEKVQKEMIYLRSRKAAKAGLPLNDSMEKETKTGTAFPEEWGTPQQSSSGSGKDYLREMLGLPE
ncbi:MAG: hypothetical protein NC311_13155 [Muribaculaceae bacterium]|nr:hypothetical protein [Muribaculaceae bacterium]